MGPELTRYRVAFLFREVGHLRGADSLVGAQGLTPRQPPEFPEGLSMPILLRHDLSLPYRSATVK